MDSRIVPIPRLVAGPGESPKWHEDAPSPSQLPDRGSVSPAPVGSARPEENVSLFPSDDVGQAESVICAMWGVFVEFNFCLVRTQTVLCRQTLAAYL